MKNFSTYIQNNEFIKPEDQVFLMYTKVNNSWKFKGIVSKQAKEIIQSTKTIDEMNALYKEQEILATFTGVPVEKTQKTYMFIPCNNAEVSTFIPTYE